MEQPLRYGERQAADLEGHEQQVVASLELSPVHTCTAYAAKASLVAGRSVLARPGRLACMTCSGLFLNSGQPTTKLRAAKTEAGNSGLRC